MSTLRRFVGFAFTAFLPIALLTGCGTGTTDETAEVYDASQDVLRFENEGHLKNIRQLTFGGNNAEAYWSFDDEKLIFQSDWSEINDQGCDQIYIMDPDGPDGYEEVSTGEGARPVLISYRTDALFMGLPTSLGKSVLHRWPMSKDATCGLFILVTTSTLRKRTDRTQRY